MLKLSLLTCLVLLTFSGHSQCPAIAAFNLNPQNGCTIPHTVFFTDQSTLPDTWFWDFGDGATSTAQNPIHSYSSTGDFIVTLTVSDTIAGCSDVATDTVSVYIPNPNFSATPTVGCAPLSVNFSDLSLSAATYTWDFGDGSPAGSGPGPSHIYTQPGIYSVTLSVVAPNGCSDNITKTNYIEVNGPVVDFSSDYAAVSCGTPVTVNFTDNTIPDAAITNWAWNFGDGNTSPQQNPTTIYNYVGGYDVSLTVTDADGCTGFVSYPSLIVIDSIYSSVDADVICMGDDYTFHDGTTFTNITSDTMYTSVFQTAVGMCDSVITTSVFINQPDTSITKNGLTLYSSATGATYQWLDCDNGYAPLTGETTDSLVVNENGSYAVEVTTGNGCTDTSACMTIADVSVGPEANYQFVVYPNPTSNNVWLKMNGNSPFTEIKILDLSGRLLSQYISLESNAIYIELPRDSGVYIIEVTGQNNLISRSTVVKH